MRTIRLRTKIPRNGLQLEYLFAGNANDSSGNSRNGTVYNCTLTTGRKGVSNMAYYFPNNTAYYINTNYGGSTPTDLTVTAWIKRTGTSGNWEMYIAKSTSGQYAGFYWYETALNISYGGTVFYLNYTAGDLVTQTWMFVAFRKTGTFWELFLNNVPQANVNVTMTDDTTNYLLGKHTGGSHPFYGNIDSVRIYNRALTNKELDIIIKAYK